MITIEELIEIKIDTFIKYKKSFISQIKGPFKKYIEDNSSEEHSSFPKEVSDKDLALFTAAVAQSYGDAKRTFKGIAQKWEKDSTKKTSDNRDAFFEEIAKEIIELFNNPPEDSDAFDKWHHETCIYFCSALDHQLAEKKPYTTYGQAQKVINMTFKYLYCLEGSEAYDSIFSKCHMPLDSYTLEWIHRVLLPWKKEKSNVKFYKGKIPAWSKFSCPEAPDINRKKTFDDNDKYLYTYFASLLKDYFDIYKEGFVNTPLKAEFIIWPQVQFELAAETFYSKLIEYLDEDTQKKDFASHSEKNIIKNISEKLNESNSIFLNNETNKSTG